MSISCAGVRVRLLQFGSLIRPSTLQTFFLCRGNCRPSALIQLAACLFDLTGFPSRTFGTMDQLETLPSLALATIFSFLSTHLNTGTNDQQSFRATSRCLRSIAEGLINVLDMERNSHEPNKGDIRSPFEALQRFPKKANLHVLRIWPEPGETTFSTFLDCVLMDARSKRAMRCVKQLSLNDCSVSGLGFYRY